MDRLKTVGPLALAAPVALGAVLAAAPQASAGIGGAVLSNPHVVDNGKTLSVVFSGAVTDAATDNTIARNVAGALGGDLVSGLVDYALQHNTPASVSTCRVTASATDSNGAAGNASAAIPVGATTLNLDMRDMTPGTKWGIGDLDHFSMKLACTDGKSSAQVSEVTVDEDETAS